MGKPYESHALFPHEEKDVPLLCDLSPGHPHLRESGLKPGFQKFFIHKDKPQ